jgi:hypothetical protein
LLALLSFSVSLFGQYLLTGLSNLKNDFFYPIPIYGRITLDAYGALLPTLVSVSLIFVYFFYAKGSLLEILACFLIAFALSSLSFQPVQIGNEIALMSLPSIVAFLVSLASIIIIFFNRSTLRSKTMLSSIRSGISRNYFVALLVTFSVCSLSALSVDLVYVPFISQNPTVSSIGIGGGGIKDGILFSGLFALVWTTFFVSLLALIVEILLAAQGKDKD